MAVETEYADGPDGNALADLNACLQAASASQGRVLYDLLFGYIEETLASMEPSKLIRYHSVRMPWRMEDKCAVYKTADTPCVAYALVHRDETDAILVLGFCINYPVDEDAWWSDVIRPRLMHHI